jgi:hypothetical protein
MTPEQENALKARLNLYPSLGGLAVTVRILGEIILQQQKELDSLIVRKP